MSGSLCKARPWVSCLLILSFLFSAGGCAVKPEPLTEEEHHNRLLADKAELAELYSLPEGPVDIYEAVARTIKYNLDNRLARMEAAFALEQLEAAQLQMLPRLALNAGYTLRNNESASSSMSYERRVQSLEPSVSSERKRNTADISFSWSLLDFGISYFQAKQQANSYLILMERRRRITNNLVKEVITAYCRLDSLENIRPQVEKTIAEAEEALASYRRLERRDPSFAVEALEQQRAILSVLRQLRQLSTDLEISRARLAALLHIPREHKLEIVPLAKLEFAPPRLELDLTELENLGVFLRPDLREEAYRHRIDKDEVKKEIVRLFPGVTLFSGGYYDSNNYLVHNFWAETGAKASLDILALPARIKSLQNAETQLEVSRLRRLAGTVAAMLQIDMSYYHYRLALSNFDDASELSRIDQKLLKISSAAARSQSIGRMEHIRQSVSSLSTRLDEDRQMLEVFAAWANLYFSVGCDIMEDLPADLELDEVTEAVKAGLQRMLDGELPALPEFIDPVDPAAGPAEELALLNGERLL